MGNTPQVPSSVLTAVVPGREPLTVARMLAARPRRRFSRSPSIWLCMASSTLGGGGGCGIFGGSGIFGLPNSPPISSSEDRILGYGCRRPHAIERQVAAGERQAERVGQVGAFAAAFLHRVL